MIRCSVCRSPARSLWFYITVSNPLYHEVYKNLVEVIVERNSVSSRGSWRVFYVSAVFSHKLQLNINEVVGCSEWLKKCSLLLNTRAADIIIENVVRSDL